LASTVQQLAVHTVGGVVTPAQQLMVIVPAGAQLEAEAMVSNRDIGFVHPGQPVELKVDTFNFTRYGLIHGEVSSVSQDFIVRDKPADRSRAAKPGANALLGLPPVVVGLALYLLLSRSGPLGPAGLLFTPTAIVIAQTLLAAPIVVALVHRPATLLWVEYGDLARTDGLSTVRSIALLFALGRASLLTAFLAAFGRAIAEVGAVVIVGGNIHEPWILT
jgi:ABC-type tungstate transport system substrate-binding protein